MQRAEQDLDQLLARFRTIEERLRADARAVADGALDELVAAADAIIPELAGAALGRALVVKANVLWWKHFRALRASADEDAPSAQARAGIACALEGRALLRRHDDTGALGWADEVVRRLQGTA